MPRILIYGAGAMGTALGALLKREGVDVDLMSRNEGHIEALKLNGATVCGKENFCVLVNAYLPDEITGKYDIVFLMTKQRENEKNAEEILDLLSPEGIVVTMQNGLPELSLKDILGEEKTYGSAVSWGASFLDFGKVEITSSVRTFSIGGVKPEESKLKKIKDILSKVGEVIIEKNYIGARFSKLSVNSAFSTLSVITGETFGKIASRRRESRLALAIINESFAVAKASGITLQPIQGHDMEKYLSYGGFFKNALSRIALKISMRKHKDLLSGMLYDVKRGRKCDVDFVAGVISSMGKKYSVPTPVTDRAIELVHGIENGFYEITPKNTDFFD